MRSFQDSDGDGVGDIAGVTSRLDYLAGLGVDAIWLSPIYPSPLHDGGYDVSDHCAIRPDLGSLEQFAEFVRSARERDLLVLLDLVPNHTSIEHPWFWEHPDWFVWSDEGPPNNWLAAFGGPSWTLWPESGRWYLHSFYPEEPDLDWRKNEVRIAFAEVISFWTARGVDGGAERKFRPKRTDGCGLTQLTDSRCISYRQYSAVFDFRRDAFEFAFTDGLEQRGAVIKFRGMPVRTV